MLIGIISDIHNKMGEFQKSLETFKFLKVDYILCAGDWTKAESITQCDKILKDFEDFHQRFFTVFGNNDILIYELLKEKKLNLNYILWSQDISAHFSFDKIKIALYHGHEKDILNTLIKSKEFNVIFTGHTHRAKKEIINDILVVNPGSIAFGHPRYKDYIKTVCTFDTVSQNIKFHEISL